MPPPALKSLVNILVIASFPAFSQEEMVVDSETLDGKLMYEAWCSRCHGIDGKGEVEGIQLETPVPDFTDCSFTSREPRKDWVAVILQGGPVRGLAMTMPAWGEAVSQEQAEAIVTHMKTFCTETGWPEGDLNFRRPHVTAKAFPENEALVIPAYTADSRSLQTKIVYERRIGAAGQWEVSLPVVSRFAKPNETGLGDIEVAGKIAFHHDAASLSIASFGLEVGVPTGSRTNGFGTGVWKVSPFLAAARRIGSTFLQSSVKIEKPLSAGRETELFYNVAWTVPLTDEKKGFFPMIELNGISSLGGGRSTLFVTPQMHVGLVKRGHIAFSAGVQIPAAGEKLFDYRLVSFLLWEYADGGLWW